MRGEARFAEETLLIEWPNGEAAPTKFWLATVDRNMSFRGLVDVAKLCWRIERDYHDLKQEIGLGRYEGRGWRGLPSSRHAINRQPTASGSPNGRGFPLRTTFRRSKSKNPPFPVYRPRGAPDLAAAPCPQLDRNDPSPVGWRNCSDPSPAPALRPALPRNRRPNL
jgi:hypothetical protein